MSIFEWDWKKGLRRLLILIASLWLCSVALKGFRISISAAAQAIIDVIIHAEALVIGSWLKPILNAIVQLLNKFGYSLHLEDQSRYAFNLIELKLLGDARVDCRRFKKTLTTQKIGDLSVFRQIEFAAYSRELHFLLLEFLIGFSFALLTAIAVSQYPFGGTSIAFAVWLICGVLAYELAKALLHILFNLHKKGSRSNAKRYLVQFFGFTVLTAIVAFATGHHLSNLAMHRNDGLLTVFIFIFLLSIQQFISAGWTSYLTRSQSSSTSYFNLGQFEIGKQMISLLMLTLGLMVILANLF